MRRPDPDFAWRGLASASSARCASMSPAPRASASPSMRGSDPEFAWRGLDLASVADLRFRSPSAPRAGLAALELSDEGLAPSPSCPAGRSLRLAPATSSPAEWLAVEDAARSDASLSARRAAVPGSAAGCDACSAGTSSSPAHGSTELLDERPPRPDPVVGDSSAAKAIAAARASSDPEVRRTPPARAGSGESSRATSSASPHGSGDAGVWRILPTRSRVRLDSEGSEGSSEAASSAHGSSLLAVRRAPRVRRGFARGASDGLSSTASTPSSCGSAARPRDGRRREVSAEASSVGDGVALAP